MRAILRDLGCIGASRLRPSGLVHPPHDLARLVLTKWRILRYGGMLGSKISRPRPGSQQMLTRLWRRGALSWEDIANCDSIDFWSTFRLCAQRPIVSLLCDCFHISRITNTSRDSHLSCCTTNVGYEVPWPQAFFFFFNRNTWNVPRRHCRQRPTQHASRCSNPTHPSSRAQSRHHGLFQLSITPALLPHRRCVKYKQLYVVVSFPTLQIA